MAPGTQSRLGQPCIPTLAAESCHATYIVAITCEPFRPLPSNKHNAELIARSFWNQQQSQMKRAIAGLATTVPARQGLLANKYRISGEALTLDTTNTPSCSQS